MNTIQTKQKFLPHVHLENLIKNKFGVSLTIRHAQNVIGRPEGGYTSVTAYSDKHAVAPIAQEIAYCRPGEAFNKRTGLTVSLRRLYRTLAEFTKE